MQDLQKNVLDIGNDRLNICDFQSRKHVIFSAIPQKEELSKIYLLFIDPLVGSDTHWI